MEWQMAMPAALMQTQLSSATVTTQKHTIALHKMGKWYFYSIKHLGWVEMRLKQVWQGLTETNYLISMDCEHGASWRWQAEYSQVPVMLRVIHQRTVHYEKWSTYRIIIVNLFGITVFLLRDGGRAMYAYHQSSLLQNLCCYSLENAVMFCISAVWYYLGWCITSLPSWGSELRMPYNKRTCSYWNFLKSVSGDLMCLHPKYKNVQSFLRCACAHINIYRCI